MIHPVWGAELPILFVRRGKQRAIVATGRSVLVIAYQLPGPVTAVLNHE